MRKICITILILPMVVLCQSNYKPTKTELTKVYTQAIGDFIKAVNLKHKTKFDTLFFGNRKYGQPDDFPDITLPESIENVHIRLMDPVTGEKKQKERKSLIYINLVGWVDKERAEFIFVIFSNQGEHQYDYFINYKANRKSNLYEIEKVDFKYFKYKNEE